jgi:ribose/xylose/arabinose/galactoside ABC-type transport system permease subunit
VTGAVIILAVAVDQLVRRQRERRARDAVDLG